MTRCRMALVLVFAMIGLAPSSPPVEAAVTGSSGVDGKAFRHPDLFIEAVDEPGPVRFGTTGTGLATDLAALGAEPGLGPVRRPGGALGNPGRVHSAAPRPWEPPALVRPRRAERAATALSPSRPGAPCSSSSRSGSRSSGSISGGRAAPARHRLRERDADPHPCAAGRLWPARPRRRADRGPQPRKPRLAGPEPVGRRGRAARSSHRREAGAARGRRAPAPLRGPDVSGGAAPRADPARQGGGRRRGRGERLRPSPGLGGHREGSRGRRYLGRPRGRHERRAPRPGGHEPVPERADGDGRRLPGEQRRHRPRRCREARISHAVRRRCRGRRDDLRDGRRRSGLPGRHDRHHAERPLRADQ